jgi:radical SAM protein with 4Fe4S-binding SPASM domain
MHPLAASVPASSSPASDPLAPTERLALLARPRPPRPLPLFADGGARRRSLPLAEPRPEDSRHKPLLAVWELTLRCDLACRHCGSRAGRARPDELTTAECLDLIDQLADLGTREVAIIGGEAYLRDDWLEIVAAIRSRGMLPTMTTGGRGMTRERAEAAARAGLHSVSVSVDGEEATHDRLRGVQGSHRSALDAIAHLRAAGIPVAANTQINRLSRPELPAVFERLAAAGIRSWQIQLTVAMGRAVDEPDVLLQPYDLVALFPMLAELVRRAEQAHVDVIAGNNIGYFGPFEKVLRGRTRKGHACGCGAGKMTLGIEADGTIKGCPSLATNEWAGGNVRDTRLRDIWERATPLRYTRDRTTADLWGYCATCYYADECRAGCTWTGDVLFGRPGNNPYCHHRATQLAKQGLRERVVRVQAAPGESFDRGLFELVVEPSPGSAGSPTEGRSP